MRSMLDAPSHLPFPARTALLGVLLLASLDASLAQSTQAFREMNRPAPPFRIMGNLYYVGANSVTSFLITTPEGHILIDGGFVETVPLIRRGVEALGFRFEDIRVLLNSHGHIDHAGGLAEIKRLTGAKLIASELEAPLLERGGRGDDLLGDAGAYEPVEVDRRLPDRGTVELGGMKLTAHVTAGHTRGCTSWAFEIDDAGVARLAVSICSLSILPGVRLGTNPTYPGIAEDYARSIERLASLPCEVFLAAHAGFFHLAEKRERLPDADSNPFIDPDGYREYLARARQRLDERRGEERGDSPPP